MARKNPLGKIKDAADVAVLTVVGTVTETVKDPIGTGQKVVGVAVGQAAAAVGAVTSRVGGRKGSGHQQSPAPVATAQDAPRKTEGDPVKPAAKKAPAKKTSAKKAPAKKAPAKKSAAKKAPAKKSAAEKAPAKTAPLSNTEPLLDPALTKAVKAEAETGAKASDVDKD